MFLNTYKNNYSQYWRYVARGSEGERNGGPLVAETGSRSSEGFFVGFLSHWDKPTLSLMHMFFQSRSLVRQLIKFSSQFYFMRLLSCSSFLLGGQQQNLSAVCPCNNLYDGFPVYRLTTNHNSLFILSLVAYTDWTNNMATSIAWIHLGIHKWPIKLWPCAPIDP